eukprot:5984395-Prymnesium_polylepis.1
MRARSGGSVAAPGSPQLQRGRVEVDAVEDGLLTVGVKWQVGILDHRCRRVAPKDSWCRLRKCRKAGLLGRL